MTRPSWDRYFARITEDVAARSTCTRHKFGAIIVNGNHEIVATGYNGVVRGYPHCEDIGCIKDEQNIDSGMGHGICPAVHAEQNALIQAGRNSLGCTLYINAYPCKICARLIVNAGISKVVVSGDYADKDGLKILEDAGVEVINLNGDKDED
ncbi:MAG: cytidine/deoxycytidylate deaminase family protein [Candidatus Altiarchaeales archaeon]|nr:cytidine/deoxycytidylate deaminase family protein [Candidatus Altiarchaeota archaeon]MBU4266233.1 cytidine/deoxycytidylate deaminase family protein [Candidatus Altiarchaeota archaeon]MBU4341313.1 cytidine/deoxycytidylate deaminase family protein [Candidatus Altiarchaeota archaeon]MBU4406791.1 cytidine/deoxycytidylate deaminase family protein [Candidatus Altiarchaeota archaeon]MCG2783059.1 cytidine/deoxycytidylate deaminase family protein [Candidatus Altiarchaeales archaeon]